MERELWTMHIEKAASKATEELSMMRRELQVLRHSQQFTEEDRRMRQQQQQQFLARDRTQQQRPFTILPEHLQGSQLPQGVPGIV